MLYTTEELKALCDYVHSQDMYVYIDGARIGNAITALDTNLAEMIEYADVDAFSLGGTKAGAMFGEMVIFRRKEFAKHLAYIQKQSLQHFDKSKFIGAQFVCLPENGIWLENARKGNDAARLLEKKLLEKGISSYYPVQTNMVFAPITPEQLERLNTVYDFHYWDEELQFVRFATTANTTLAEIDRLVSLL